jgi:hypothetical protein
MKKVWIIAASLCVLSLASPVFAAGKPGKAAKKQDAFAKYDKNGNGTIDDDEKDAIKKAFDTDKSLKKLDTDGNGKLDDKEIEAMKPHKKGGKKKNQ